MWVANVCLIKKNNFSKLTIIEFVEIKERQREIYSGMSNMTYHLPEHEMRNY